MVGIPAHNKGMQMSANRQWGTSRAYTREVSIDKMGIYRRGADALEEGKRYLFYLTEIYKHNTGVEKMMSVDSQGC